MSDIVVFLQNAWSPLYAGGTWPRPSWLRALARSRTGQRLTFLIDDLDCCEETTPIVGATPSIVIPPDEAHCKAVLCRRALRLVIACGKQAERTLLPLWRGPLLILPHPAHRVVTNTLYSTARALLPSFGGRLAIRQEKHGLRYELLST